MARTAHQHAVEHLVTTALGLQARVNHAAVFDPALQPLADAIDTVVMARGNVAQAVVFTQKATTPAARAAALAAMKHRSKWQALVYEAICRSSRGLTDEQIEARITSWWRLGRHYTCIHLGGPPVQIAIPGEAKHQTVSSARNALCALGLVAADGEIVVRGHRQTLWKDVT